MDKIVFNGSSSQAAAIQYWMKTGQYVEPKLNTQDFRTLEFIGQNGAEIAVAGDTIQLLPDGAYIVKRPQQRK